MPNDAFTESVIPSENTINFIYKGLLAFYPEIAAPVFDLPKGTYGSMESWAGFDKSEFLEFVFDITAQYRLTTDLEEAARIIKDWKEGRYPERTIPGELDQLVAALEEKGTAGVSPFERREAVKKTQLLARRIRETQAKSFKLPQGPSVIIPSPETKLKPEVPLIYIEPTETLHPKAELDRMGRLLSDRLRESAKSPGSLEKEKEALKIEVLDAAKGNLPRVMAKVPPSQLEKVIDAIVDKATERLTQKSFTPQPPDPQILAPLTSDQLTEIIPDPSLREKVAATATESLRVSQAESSIARILLEPVLGTELTATLFPSQPTKYRVTSQPTSATVAQVDPTIFTQTQENIPVAFEHPSLKGVTLVTPPTEPPTSQPAAVIETPTPREFEVTPTRANESRVVASIAPTPAVTKNSPAREKTMFSPSPEPVKVPEITEPIPEKEVIEQEPVVTPPTIMSTPISTTPVPIISSFSEQVVPSEKTVSFLYNGLLALYPETATEIFNLPRENYQSRGSWAGFGRKEFSEFVCKVTGSSNLSEAAIVIRKWHEGRALDRTIPVNINELVEKLDEMNAKKASAYELQTNVRKAIAQSQRLKEKWEIQIPPTPEAAIEELEFSIYLEPSEPVPPLEFTENDLKVLRVDVALQNPRQYVVDLTDQIVTTIELNAPEYTKSIPPDQLRAVAETLATRTTQVIRGEYAQLEPSHWAIAALGNAEDPVLIKLFPDSQKRQEFVEAAQFKALQQQATYVLDRNLLDGVFGPEIAEKVLGPEGPIRYRLSETRMAGSEYEFAPEEFLRVQTTTQIALTSYRSALEKGDLEHLQRTRETSLDALQKLRSSVSWATDTKEVLSPSGLFKSTGVGIAPTEGYRETVSLATIWPGGAPTTLPLAEGDLLNIVTTSTGERMVVTPFLKLLNINFGPAGFIQISYGHIGLGTVPPELAGRIVQGLAGQAGKPAVAIAAKLGGKTISAVSTKLGAVVAKLTGFITKISAFLGTVVPGVGNIVSTVIAWIGGKALEKGIVFIQKHKKTFAAVLFSPLVLVGIIFGLPVLTIMGGVGMGVVLAGGVGQFVTGVGNATIGFVKAITSLSLASIGTPLLITIISIPALVAIILFIINSGAYLVPPKTGFEPGVVVSPYIDISKTASPAGPFSNSDLPKTIEYTVTIRAKKSTLSDIRISDLCDVVAKGTKPTCPIPSPLLPKQGDPNYPESIAPTGSGFTFKYQRTFTSPGFNDTLVTNTITVTANVPEKQDEMASSGVSIKFGNPPEECPSGWPILPENGETHLDITQGPLGTYSHSQAKLEAIDIGANIGHTVSARHSGTVKVHQDNFGNYGPKYVDIISNCGGKTFFSRYAHLSAVSVATGQAVTLGQKIGNSGTSPGGAHLHYEFQGLKMTPKCTSDANYRCIPKAVPYGCPGSCGTIP